MRTRTLNKVILIGNVVRKPELNKTIKGESVCNFHLITDRRWRTSLGEEREESTRHNCLAWSKLAEICHTLLDKGSLVYIEGNLTERKVTRPNQIEATETEIVISVNEMMLMNSNRKEPANGIEGNYSPN